ncbi:MAG: YidC/Oxa1 family membrane protein insertase [Oscillospiraceae bacterium]|jgi:YidC/Oxa1 family membrane protein insertase|nr:YidC/Oxa1 family membrane protein insertase [Oscillospiraceae bacterium]
MSIITVPFSWLLMQFYDLCGNIGGAVILFALAVNLILLPFMAKSKKSMMHQSRLQPRIQQLQAKHGGNPQILNQEMSKLYREEGVKPMAGCLWSLIPFPILIALYSVIRKPLTVMMGLSAESVTLIQTTLENMGLLNVAEMTSRQETYLEITLTQLCHEHFSELSGLVDGLKDISYNFLGMNLGATPQVFFWNAEGFGTGNWWPVFGLFLIPFVSALVSWLSMKLSMSMNPATGTDAQTQQMQATNKSMQLMMPLMSLWIGFTMPGAMGVYWIFNYLFNMVRDAILTKHYKKKLYEDDAEWRERERQRELAEAEQERRRAEAERRKAAGEILENKNISKKKLQAAEKQKAAELKAAAIAADKAARRERLGIEEAEAPASQVGSRRYARGRAYDPDRFGVQEEFSPETEAAETEESQESTL